MCDKIIQNPPKKGARHSVPPESNLALRFARTLLLPRHAQVTKITGISDLAVTQCHGEVPVCLSTNPADQVVHGAQAVSAEKSDSSNGLQVLDDFFKSAVQFSD